MIFNHAAKELNQALLYRQKQFSNKDLYFKIAPSHTTPQIALEAFEDVSIIELSIAELLEDDAIQQQLSRIPKILCKQINWPKLINYINRQLQIQLDQGHSIYVFAGSKQPTISIKKGQQIIESSVTLKDLFS